MRLFLLWNPPGPEPGGSAVPPPEAVGARLARLYADVLAARPAVRVLCERHAALVTLELPVEGFEASFFEEDEETWAFATEYPWNLRSVLESHGLGAPPGRRLVALARGLDEHPERLLADLAPPFSLVWCRKRTGEVFFRNDGLGQAQTFACERDGLTAITSRPQALRALGLPLAPVAEEWATRLTLGWFPRDRSGLRDVRYVEPGTCLRFGRRGVREERTDVLTSWVQPEPMSREDSLELALESMLEMARDAKELWRKPSVGLSGGWDSRMVVASLRAVGSDFTARVRGTPERYDVMIASELARLADLPLRYKTQGGWPSDDADGCRRSIERALLWQAGNMATKKHKSFLGRKDGLDGGTINVMGQHGGLGKADFAVKTDAVRLDPGRHEDALVAKLLGDASPCLRPDHLVMIEDEVRAAHRRADDHGLEGLARLHFFFLHEYTRRWASGAINSQSGMVYAPILNPKFVRAAYAFPEEELGTKPFHRHVIRTLSPDWADVPYEGDTSAEELEARGIRPVQLKQKKMKEVYGRETWKRPRRHRKFSNSRYWRHVGRPLLDEALAQGGFWTEILDPDLAREHWMESGDVLAVAHVVPAAFPDVAGGGSPAAPREEGMADSA